MTKLKPFPTSPTVTLKMEKSHLCVYPRNVQRSQDGSPCFHYNVGESQRILKARVPPHIQDLLQDGFTVVVDRSIV